MELLGMYGFKLRTPCSCMSLCKREQKMYKLLSLILLALISSSPSQGIKVSCDDALVEDGKRSTLTFYFTEDISHSRRSVRVKHLIASREENVLTCHWLNSMECDIRPTFTFDGTITNELSIEIPETTLSHEGRYACFVLSDDPSNYAICNLTIITKQQYVLSSPISPRPVIVTKTPTPPEEPSPSGVLEDYRLLHVVIDLVALVVLLLIFGIVFACLYRRKRQLNNPDFQDNAETILIKLPPKCKAAVTKEDKTISIMIKEQAREVPTCRQMEPREEYWVQCIRQWYPDLHSRTYFFPPIHVNRVPYEMLEVAGEVVLVRQTTQEGSDGTTTSSTYQPQSHEIGGECSKMKLGKRKLEDLPTHEMWIRTYHNALRQVGESDTRGDTAVDCVLASLRKMADDCEPKEAMMIISQLPLGQFFPTNSTAIIPFLSSKFQSLPQKYRQGDLDVLIIHKKYGMILGEVKSVGASPSQQRDGYFENGVKAKILNSIRHLDKAEVVLKLLISDLPKIPVMRTIMLPNMKSFVLQNIIDNDSQLAKELQDFLCVSNTKNAMKLILCMDQVEEPVKENMKDWFNQFAAMASKANISSDIFERIVARFCGPEITIQIHSVTYEPNELKTEGEGVSEAGKNFTRLVLTPQHINILRLSPSQAFLEGPPGTEKTVVLTLQGLNWLRRGFDVHLVSTWKKSRSAAIMMEHQLNLKHLRGSPESQAKVYLHFFDFERKGDIDAAVTELTKGVISASQLCILVETAGPDGPSFESFCNKLIKTNPSVYLWCTAAYRDMRPKCLQDCTMSELLRIPAPVRHDVDKAEEMKDGRVTCYTSNQSVTEKQGPLVKIITHTVGEGCHSQSTFPEECEQCGHELARLLKELNVGDADVPLQFRDVMVLCNNPHNFNMDSNCVITSNLISGLSAKGFPVCVLTPAQQESLTQDNISSKTGEHIRNLVLGVTDMVMVTHSDCVWGLKRKIVVVANYGTGHNALIDPARCSSQLVLIQSIEQDIIK